MQRVELLAIKDPQVNGMAVCLKPRIPFVITHSMVAEVRRLQNKIAEEYYQAPWHGVYHLFWYLHAAKIPWKGLDFNYIHQCLINNKEADLETYIDNLFSLLFINYIGFDLPLVSCSIINRQLSGISMDFFYLNRINFIKLYGITGGRKRIDEPCKKLNFHQEVKRVAFPNEIYQRNDFYKLNSLDVTTMRNILSRNQFVPLSAEEKAHVRTTFDQIRDDTLARIYLLASKNIKLISRFALVQASEHKKHTAKN